MTTREGGHKKQNLWKKGQNTGKEETEHRKRVNGIQEGRGVLKRRTFFKSFSFLALMV